MWIGPTTSAIPATTLARKRFPTDLSAANCRKTPAIF
jgi:hypothetical protein